MGVLYAVNIWIWAFSFLSGCLHAPFFFFYFGIGRVPRRSGVNGKTKKRRAVGLSLVFKLCKCIVSGWSCRKLLVWVVPQIYPGAGGCSSDTDNVGLKQAFFSTKAWVR